MQAALRPTPFPTRAGTMPGAIVLLLIAALLAIVAAPAQAQQVPVPTIAARS